MRFRMSCLGVMLALAAVASAQPAASVPNTTDVYCSGLATSEAVPTDSYLISGEQSNYRVVFSQGDYVYINRGSSQGAKVGDEYVVVRPVNDISPTPWFSGQHSLWRAMGKLYKDLGRLRVVNVQEKVSVAEVVFSCDPMWRGDLVQPFAERPAPPYKESAAFDRFAPASGKAQAMVIASKDFAQETGTHGVIYINLGSGQGVKVGDYFRVFRYQGTRRETAYQTYGTAHQMYGFGHTPVAYSWNALPREVLGEGIVLRVSPNSSTVLLTYSLKPIYTGDYVEIE